MEELVEVCLSDSIFSVISDFFIFVLIFDSIFVFIKFGENWRGLFKWYYIFFDIFVSIFVLIFDSIFVLIQFGGTWRGLFE